MRRILFISGSLGLGHVVRDLAIAKELRRLRDDVEITWIASHPASVKIEEVGEVLHPCASSFANDNVSAEESSQGTNLNLLKYLSRARGAWDTNVRLFDEITRDEEFDLVIGDETYELLVGQMKDLSLNRVPFVMIYDFLGVDAMTWNPGERVMSYVWNRIWSQDRKLYSTGRNIALFVGEPEDVPDRRFGLLLPNRRAHAREHYSFIGYIIDFDPTEYRDREALRAGLGYGSGPLIVCSVGGTSVGRDLLELCGNAYTILRERLPDVQMLAVCGPRIDPGSIDLPEGVDVRGYVPRLYEHFAACDLAIVLGGGTTTLELTCLQRPFLYFPIEGHFEQELTVSSRLARHRAGERMSFSGTTPDSLAERVVASIGKEVDYDLSNMDGARVAARKIADLL